MAKSIINTIKNLALEAGKRATAAVVNTANKSIKNTPTGASSNTVNKNALKAAKKAARKIKTASKN